MTAVRISFCAIIAFLSSLPMAAQASPAPAIGIPDGAKFLVRLDDKLDTRHLRPGKRFKAKLSEDLTGPDGSLIEHGRKIRGHVSAVENGFHSRLLLSFDEIESRRGWKIGRAHV